MSLIGLEYLTISNIVKLAFSVFNACMLMSHLNFGNHVIH